ncbi:hypothetical protein AGMMS49949_05500 [Alphaproteobacteria bacterium]|nr:hypothetical protein AGMMS49949_05500 [Alphaproteobacteria bacterium]GHS98083.1 hypothetical protein AGMMS50296_5550 [Alphaproteobacteria bacterium]
MLKKGSWDEEAFKAAFEATVASGEFPPLVISLSGKKLATDLSGRDNVWCRNLVNTRIRDYIEKEAPLIEGDFGAATKVWKDTERVSLAIGAVSKVGVDAAEDFVEEPNFIYDVATDLEEVASGSSSRPCQDSAQQKEKLLESEYVFEHAVASFAAELLNDSLLNKTEARAQAIADLMPILETFGRSPEFRNFCKFFAENKKTEGKVYWEDLLAVAATLLDPRLIRTWIYKYNESSENALLSLQSCLNQDALSGELNEPLGKLLKSSKTMDLSFLWEEKVNGKVRRLLQEIKPEVIVAYVLEPKNERDARCALPFLGALSPEEAYDLLRRTFKEELSKYSTTDIYHSGLYFWISDLSFDFEKTCFSDSKNVDAMLNCLQTMTSEQRKELLSTIVGYPMPSRILTFFVEALASLSAQEAYALLSSKGPSGENKLAMLFYELQDTPNLIHKLKEILCNKNMTDQMIEELRLCNLRYHLSGTEAETFEDEIRKGRAS